jgi:hypothetical protein
MNEVTREDLVEWFGSDHEISETTLRELNQALDDDRMRVFEEFGFRDE